MLEHRFCNAADDYSNFRYKKFILGIKMIRQISNLDDEKKVEKNSKGGAAMNVDVFRERKTAKSSFCPSKSQKLEQLYIRIFLSFFFLRAKYFFPLIANFVYVANH